MEVLLRLSADSCTEAERRGLVEKLKAWADRTEQDEGLRFTDNPQLN